MEIKFGDAGKDENQRYFERIFGIDRRIRVLGLYYP